MSRYLQIAAVVGLLAWAGCQEPKVTDAHLMISPEQVQMVEQVGFLMPQATEVDYVEQVAATRNAYQQALLNLITYYESTGNASKLQWARNELATFLEMAHYRYLMPGEFLPQQLQASDSILEADELYAEAMGLYRASGGLIIVADEGKLRHSLQLFNRLITDYPTSDKIDDAAYRAARIYDHFRDYDLAAIYYQRTFQWDENTPFPARFRAAYTLDYRLKKRDEALTLYQLAVEKESRFANNTEFARMRIAALMKPKGMEEEGQPIERIEGE